MSDLHFTKQGDGFPILFLHGFCETHEIWDEFIKPLISEFQIFTLDLPGFGKSPLLSGPISIDLVADQIAEWIVGNKISQCIVIGHSLGGYVALSLVERYPHIVRGLGLFHSTSFADTEEKKKNRNRIIEFVSKNGVQPFIDTYVPGLFYSKTNPSIQAVYEIAKGTKKEALIQYTKAMRDREEKASVLRNPDLPKLIIAGVEDTSVSIESSREMLQIAQNCSFHELEKVAHMGIFEAQTGCQKIIKNFSLNIT
jgi:pimeloyl-ACP methyl ester carboxylesterase